jgi:hypothetical protein
VLLRTRRFIGIKTYEPTDELGGWLEPCNRDCAYANGCTVWAVGLDVVIPRSMLHQLMVFGKGGGGGENFNWLHLRSLRLSTPNGTVTILGIFSLRNWKKMKLTRPTFNRMAIRLIQRICVWHSWTCCGQNHFYNYLASKISGSFSAWIFFSGVR